MPIHVIHSLLCCAWVLNDSFVVLCFCYICAPVCTVQSLQVGTFTLFQESYHRPTFAKMHISGPKSDFNHRLLTQDRAFRGGIDDVGIGTLFGLYDYRWALAGLAGRTGALVA